MIISKRNQRGKGRHYFLCTDLSLRAPGVLNRYAHRYQIESDYLYLKDGLGGADFRQRNLEGIERYLTLCFVALAYLQWRLPQTPEAQTLADVMREHRETHQLHFLTRVCETALQLNAVQPALQALGVIAT